MKTSSLVMVFFYLNFFVYTSLFFIIGVNIYRTMPTILTFFADSYVSVLIISWLGILITSMLMNPLYRLWKTHKLKETV